MRENDHGPTTGKHLNSVDGGSTSAKNLRVPSDEFERRLDAVLNRFIIQPNEEQTT